MTQSTYRCASRDTKLLLRKVHSARSRDGPATAPLPVTLHGSERRSNTLMNPSVANRPIHSTVRILCILWKTSSCMKSVRSFSSEVNVRLPGVGHGSECDRHPTHAALSDACAAMGWVPVSRPMLAQSVKKRQEILALFPGSSSLVLPDAVLPAGWVLPSRCGRPHLKYLRQQLLPWCVSLTVPLPRHEC